MKIPVLCPYCMKEAANQTVGSEYAVLRDDCTFEVMCANQHEFISVLSNPKFEVLYMYGRSALEAGYLREAISSFSVSMERYYEFFLKVKHHVDRQTLCGFMDSWNLIAAQSERQLGAYVFAYNSLHGKAPKLLSNSMVKLRNSVVHKGYIPTVKETEKFQNSVVEILKSNVAELQEHFYPSVAAVLDAQYADVSHDSKVSAMSELGVISPDIVRFLGKHVHIDT